MSTLNGILGLSLGAAVLLQPCSGFAQAAAGADQPATAAPAALSASPPVPAPATPAAPAEFATPATLAVPPASPPAVAPAPSPAASSAVITQPRLSVAVVITPELKAIVWTHTSELFRPMYELGDVNNIGQATDSTIEDLLKTMALDVHVAASLDEAQKVSGAKYILVPTVQRYEEHNQGITTFAPFIETIVVQWKVTDAKQNTVLLDTVVATATGKLGNNFISATRAQNIQNKMLDDLKEKSTALLQPVLVSQ